MSTTTIGHIVPHRATDEGGEDAEDITSFASNKQPCVNGTVDTRLRERLVFKTDCNSTASRQSDPGEVPAPKERWC